MLNPHSPSIVLAPMDGITDAPMRALQGATGAFTFAVSEFQRVSHEVIPRKAFLKEVPELLVGGLTPTGLPVQVQLLGGDPELMAKSALVACEAGATAIDINYGCPAPVVNRHDGGASLLRQPERIREIVRAVRSLVPPTIPVSAKLRLGWDSVDSIHTNAAMAAEGGASWITIHARTRMQGYQPPVFWKPIRQVREALKIPVVANGDIWTLDDFQRCRDETGCDHFMLGRGALANPKLPYQVAAELGVSPLKAFPETDWMKLLNELLLYSEHYLGRVPNHTVARLKQWLNLASKFGDFPWFNEIKRLPSTEELMTALHDLLTGSCGRSWEFGEKLGVFS